MIRRVITSSSIQHKISFENSTLEVRSFSVIKIRDSECLEWYLDVTASTDMSGALRFRNDLSRLSVHAENYHTMDMLSLAAASRVRSAPHASGRCC
jgi:hypothetical protein